MHVLLCIYLVESDLSYSTHNLRNIMWALSLRGMASLVAPQGLSRDGAWASLPRGMWDLDQGLNPRPLCGDSRVTQTVENPPAVWETWVPSLGWEDSPGGGRGNPLQYSWASLVAQMVKNPPAMQETWVPSLGWEDSPGEGNGYPLQCSGLLCPWDSPGKNTGVGSHSLLQGNLPNPGMEPGSPAFQANI